MGCFCKQAVTAMQEDAQDPQPETEDQPDNEVVTAVSQWLAARWLPSPKWEPDPEWLEAELPDPTMPPAAFSVVSGLIQAQQACQSDLAIDPSEPEQVAKLARIVRTLNRRLDDLQQLAEDETPWDEVAALNDQADSVRDALQQGVLEPDQEPEQPLGPWRPLLSKVNALAPLISVLRGMDVDPTDEDATEKIADTVRKLRAVTLPPLEQPLTVFRLISRYSAVTRLQRSLGADPRKVPFHRVQKAVQRKVDAVTQQLPQTIRMVEGQLVGMVTRQPNPSQLLSPATMEQARSIPPAMLEKMRWQVPAFEQLPLLTAGAPVAKLIGLLRTLGADPVRTSPCGRDCDAGAARTGPAATGSPGSGTGAAPAR